MRKAVMVTRLALFVTGTVVVATTQRIIMAFGAKRAFTVPLAFHRMVLKILGIRVTVKGEPPQDGPVLLVANHVSWLDIPVIGSLMPLVFIAKNEVSGWAGFGYLAKLQYTIFVNRQRRTEVRKDGNAIADRLKLGDRVVLFAEGTSNDGNRVLPFKSTLVGAVLSSRSGDEPVPVQPMTLVYTGRAGLPLLRAERPQIAWYGDMTLVPHLLDIFASPPIDVTIVFGPVIDPEAVGGRKPATAIAQEFVSNTATQLRLGRYEADTPLYSQNESNALSSAGNADFDTAQAAGQPHQSTDETA